MSFWLWLALFLLVAVLVYVKRSTLYGYIYFIGYYVYVSERIGYPKHLKLIDPALHPNKVPHTTGKIEPTVLVGDDGLSGGISILPIPILEDNYSYLLVCERTGQCAVVDPSDPYVVLEAIENWNKTRSGAGAAASADNKSIDPETSSVVSDIGGRRGGSGGGLQLTHVLTTHRHWDHAGGNRILAARVPNLKVCGGARDGVDACTMIVKAGEAFRVGQMTVRVLETPCHTTGHVLYRVGGGVAGGAGGGALFTGDCLFTGGCGRFFEGNAGQMYANFVQFRRLPSDTLIFPGHEYAISNLKYAAFVEPDNQAVTDKLAWARAQRNTSGGGAGSRPTVPSTLAEEYTYNPFLRCGERSIRQRLASIKECQLSVEDLNAGGSAPQKKSGNSSGGGDSKKHDSPDESNDPLLPVSSGAGAAGNHSTNNSNATALMASNIRVLAELRRLRNADVHIPPGGNDDE